MSNIFLYRYVGPIHKAIPTLAPENPCKSLSADRTKGEKQLKMRRGAGSVRAAPDLYKYI